MSRFLALTSAALLVTGSALAGDKAGGHSMTKLDADKDGKVTKAEAKSHKELSAQFGTLDTNKDGNLDSGEFAQFEGTDPNEKANPDVLNSTDDSVEGNKDLPGPSR